MRAASSRRIASRGTKARRTILARCFLRVETRNAQKKKRQRGISEVYDALVRKATKRKSRILDGERRNQGARGTTWEKALGALGAMVARSNGGILQFHLRNEGEINDELYAARSASWIWTE